MTTTIGINGMFFETDEDQSTVQNMIERGQGVKVYMANIKDGYQNKLYAPLLFVNGVVYIDRDDQYIVENGKEIAEARAESERQSIQDEKDAIDAANAANAKKKPKKAKKDLSDNDI